MFNDGFVPSAKITNEGSYSIISDYLGTPVEAYDEEGKKVWLAKLDIYGRVKEFTGEQDFIPFRYRGQYEDLEIGLYYNRFRYYDPEQGNYTQIDPIGLAGGNPTLYGYVGNPHVKVDPWGLKPKDLTGNDATGRPLSSSFYSVWFETEISADIRSGTRPQHFRDANQRLYELLQKYPGLENSLPSEIVEHVQPGSRGGFKSTSPPKHTWHHNSYNPTKIELVPRKQHRAPGPVQANLHPNQQGGFKKLSKGC